MRHVLIVLGTALSALALLVAPVGAQEAAPAIGANAPDVSALRSIESQVAQLRGLPQKYEPELTMLDPSSLHAYLLSEFDADYLPSERESDQKAWVALGLLKASEDLVQLQLDLLSDQVVGIYNPDTKGLFVLSDGSGIGPAQRITYAHEVNHALQDQHYDLNRLAPKHHDNNDRSLAIHALLEGDAVLLQTLWASSYLTPDDFQQLALSASGSDASLNRVPLIVRTELLFPYIDGFNFVRQAYRAAGNSYAGVDDVFKNPPVATSQLLHPNKYRDGIQPVELDMLDAAERLGPAWRRVGIGTLGELDTRVLLEQWGSDRADAARVASGWAGDRWQLLEKDGRSAIVVRSVWESPDAARSFFSAHARGLRTRFDAARTEESSSTRQALTTPVAATDMRLNENEVTFVIAFDRDTATALFDAVTPFSL